MTDNDPYREFEEALADVLLEQRYDLNRRSRLAKARSNVDRNDPRYRVALERAFEEFSPIAQSLK